MNHTQRPGLAARAGASDWFLELAGLLTMLAAFEVVPRLGLISERYLPPLSSVVGSLAELVGEQEFWFALGSTLRGWGIGLTIAMVCGVLAGVVIGSTRPIRVLTASTIEFMRPIPSVALIPLAVLVYGTGIKSVLLLVVYAAFWQVLIQVLYGVQDVDPVASDTARSYRLGRWGRIRYVTWPTALPYVMTGFRLAATVALILAVTAELVIGAPGLGREISIAQSSGAVDQMYALIIVIGLIGVLVNTLTRRLERQVLAWHPSVRREAPV